MGKLRTGNFRNSRIIPQFRKICGTTVAGTENPALFPKAKLPTKILKPIIVSTIINTSIGDFKVSATLEAQGVPFPNSKDKMLHNEFIVNVWLGGHKTSFVFFDSNKNYTDNVIKLSDLKDALLCFVGDSQLGSLGFKEFCDELGYDTYGVYKACAHAYAKLSGLGISDDQMYELLNELNAY